MVGSLFSAGTSYIKLVSDTNEQLPRITYWLIGSLVGAKISQIQLVIIPMTAGLIVLTMGDDVSRNLLASEIPIGILTAFIGAPFFIYLITRKGETY